MCGLRIRKELLTQGRVRLSLISPLARIYEDKEAEILFTNPLHMTFSSNTISLKTPSTDLSNKQTTTSQI